MKRILVLMSLFMTFVPMWGQTDSGIVKLTDAQRDSVITRIQRATSFIANTHMVGGVGRYKVYSTTNIYNSLKLDTATGKVTALQINIGDTIAMEYGVADEVVPNETLIGRFELYPTQNHYNFILLDTVYGFAYQVQWSTDMSKCGRIRIW